MKYIFLLLVFLFSFLWISKKKTRKYPKPQETKVPQEQEESQEQEEPEEPEEMPQTSKQTTIPAPVGGLNARDAIANMKPEYALLMKNMYPTTRGVKTRKGVLNHVTSVGSAVESFMPYSMPDGTETLFCAAGTDFYDVTSAGTVGAAVVSSLTNARWESVNFTNSSGTSYLCCFNGVDSPEYWDNSSWTAITGVSSPAITGVTPSNLFGPMIHKRRLWTIEVDTLKAWYLPVDAVGGAANALDLSGMAKNGGYLQAIGSWTVDGGSGPDDYWCGITSKGEAIVYKGTDPSSASTWSLVGVWQIGVPLGRRCLLKYGGDLLVLTRDGIQPIPKILLYDGKIDRTIEITDLIRDEITELAKSYGDEFGWQMEYFSEANLLLLNVPENLGAYIYIPTDINSIVTTPDSASLDITGDIDVRMELSLKNWSSASGITLISKYETAGQRSWHLSIQNGKFYLGWSETGGAITYNITSTVPINITDNEKTWIRATLDVDNGAAGNDVAFYTSTDGTTWTQLGSTVTTSGTTSIYSSTSQIQFFGLLGTHGWWAIGNVYNAKIYDGIGGTLVADLNQDDMTTGASTVVSSATGETWTLSGSTVINSVKGRQYPLNTVTRRWGGEWNITANCWVIFNNKLYFGDNDNVVQAWRGNSDNGTAISFDMIQAFNYFESFGRIKQWHLIKPIFITDNDLTTISMGLLVDYEDIDETASITLAFKSPSSSWDNSILNNMQASSVWQTITGNGDCAALRIKGTVSDNELEFIAASYLYELGGVVG